MGRRGRLVDLQPIAFQAIEYEIEIILTHYKKEKNKEKIKEWMSYKENLRQFTQEGLNLLGKRIEQEHEEIKRNVPEKVKFN